MSYNNYTDNGPTQRHGQRHQQQPHNSPRLRRTLDDHYVDTAEKVIQAMNDRGNSVSTSKLRNILTMVTDINNELARLSGPAIPQNLMSKIQRLRVRIVYECGRDRAVKALEQQADFLRMLREDIGNSREKFLRFGNYIEALVAFHKFYGGRD